MITVWCTQRRHAIKRSLPNHKTVKMHHKCQTHHMKHNQKKKKKKLTHTFSHSLFKQSSQPQLDTWRMLHLMNMWGQKNDIDLKIPWFCYSAMHSNDQLFGLRMVFLSPNSQSMTAMLTILSHQREFSALILSCSTAALLCLCTNAPNSYQAEQKSCSF